MKTLGERRVRTDFNVTNDDFVATVKRMSAELIDFVNDSAVPPLGTPDIQVGEFHRLKALALTDLESGASWAVKAATWKAEPEDETGGNT